jgi:hypothetical protein
VGAHQSPAPPDGAVARLVAVALPLPAFVNAANGHAVPEPVR